MLMDTVEFTDQRRTQIIRLLEVLNDGLPVPTRRDASTSGFVNEPRARTCPDCLANGRVMFGCETCGGSGEVTGRRVEVAIAVPDELDTDGQRLDPYAQNDWLVLPYGVSSTTKIGHVPARDAAIDRVTDQLREPWKTPEDELADANRTPYPWERQRAALRKAFDIDALTTALEVVRDRNPVWSGLLHAVYVYGEPIELSARVEQEVDMALRFISVLMPAEIRAPGDEKHPALRRRDARAA